MDIPPDRLVCKICQLPCCEAQQSEYCRHIYCKCDIDQHKTTKALQPACPIYHAKDFDTYSNLATDHEIQQLMVYCPDKEASGSDWVGKLKDVEEHYSYGRECKTEYEKCKTTVKHKLLHSHLDTECPCYCPYCDITAEREVISNEHKEKCHKFPLTCPNNCGLNNVPRDNMDEHKKECPLELVPCEFNDIGCEAKLCRKDEVSHAKDCVTTHLQLAQKRLTILNKMLEDSNARYLESSENSTVLLSELQERIRTFEGIHTDQSSQSTKAQSVDVEVQTDVNSIDMFVATSTFSKLIRYFIITRNLNVLALMILMSSIVMSMSAFYVNYNRTTTTTTNNYSLPTVQEFHEKVSVVLYEVIDQSTLPWCSKLYYWSNTATIVTPVVVKFSDFSKQKYSILHSNTFFGFTNGYLMRLVVYPSGSPGIASEHLYMSVYLDFMVGPHDDKLDKLGYFPINKSFTIELLNPNDDDSHLQKEITGCNITRVTGNDNSTNYGRCGFSTFISLEGYDFMQKCTCDKANVTICCYLIDDDTIYFRILEESRELSHQIAPVSFKLTKFFQLIKNKKEWYSSPFFAFNGGYQMCLNVVAAGSNKGEGSHVSVYLYLMKGPHDDELEQSGHWPLRGTFTIELLNQLNDSDHYSHMLQFHHHLCEECTNRVLGSVMAHDGFGPQQFISHTTLYNNGYMKSDSIILRISYESKEAPHQIAPVTFRLNKFSRWMKSKEQWDSTPFIAFNGGYQMCLKVDAAGYGKGEGSHVSVYLYLMKGPHDDELEQSGHWPLRGTFTIELLNQLNDSDHHRHMVQFHHHLCEECTNRVLGEVIAQSGLGRQRFISHHTLYNNGYMKSNSLIFRVS